MFKNMSERLQNVRSSESIAAPKTPKQLRRQFLNSKVQSNSQSHIDSSLYSQISNKSPEEQQQLMPQAKQTFMIRNPKNWHHEILNLEDKPSNIGESNKEIGFGISKFDYSQSPQPRQTPKSNHNMTVTQVEWVELANYKLMLRKQIEKSRRLEEKLQKQDRRKSYMAQLVSKLQEENELLRKMYNKEKAKNSPHFYQTKKKQNKYCRCDQATASSPKSHNAFVLNRCKSDKKLH